MATTAQPQGIAQSAGGGDMQPQVHPVGAAAPLIPASEQQPRFMAPPNPVRPSPGPLTGGPLLSRPPLESPRPPGPSPLCPPPGPSPLFPPQAVMSRPPQAGAPVMPPFPPPGPPTTSVGTGMLPPPFPRLPPSVPQFPPPSQPPSNFPPGIPPPGAVPIPPPISSPLPLPQYPPPGSQNGPQVPTNATSPQHPPTILSPLTSGPPPLSLNPNQTPAGISPQMIPQKIVLVSAPSPVLSPHSQSPVGQIPPLGGLQRPPAHPQFPPGNHQVPTSATPSPGPPPLATLPQVLANTAPGPPHIPSSGHPPPDLASSPQQHSLLPASSAKDCTPLLPSPQHVPSDGGKGEVVMSSQGAEVWYEHKMSDGRVYFSHSVTRKTTWDRPQNAPIMPHPGQQRPNQMPAPGLAGAHTASPHPSLPGLPPTGMSTASHLVPSRVWSEFQTPEGKPYFYNKITRVSVWEKPKDFDLVMPLPPELSVSNLGPHAQQLPSPQRLSFPHPAPAPAPRPPLMSTPFVYPTGQPPFDSGLPPGHPGRPILNPGLLPQVARFPPPVQLLNVPSDAVSENKESKLPGEPEAMEQDSEANTLSGGGEGAETEQPNTVSSAADTSAPSAPEGDAETGEQEVVVGGASQTAPPQPAEPEPVPVKEEPKGPKPTASVPVPGTPWSVVWTSDDRQFFFDVTSRVSLWILPEELKDNPQVEKILENGPLGERKPGAPPAKRMKLGEGGESGRGEEEGEEEEEEMEEGEAALDIPTGTVLAQTEALEMEKKAAMMRSGKTVEERQEEFKGMLLERGVSAFSTWDKELPKFVFDPRYMLLNSKERKSCFEEFIRSRAEEERKEKRSKLKARRDEFRKLLEDSKLHPKSSFSEFAQRNSRDERFKAVEKMREREQLFSEYLQELKRSGAGAGAGKHKGEKSDSGPAQTSSKIKPDKVKLDFLEMLLEDGSLSEGSQWRKVKVGLERDPRYRAVTGGSSQREEWFKEYVRSLSSSDKQRPVDPSREREERIQASLKEREREVKMSRSAQEKEWGRERDQLRKSEAMQQFKAMLADTVRNTGVVWNDARRQLRQDPRWASMGLLEQEEKEHLFQDHCNNLAEKKRLQFRRLLEETSQISLVMPWKKVRKLIREDPRYKNFTESDHRREAEYDKYLRDKMITAKDEFRSLLRETKIINYKSHDLVAESGKHYKEIIKVLENDRRYLVLECVSDERERILQDYLKELHYRGPPPPPTATNPSERLRKQS